MLIEKFGGENNKNYVNAYVSMFRCGSKSNLI